MTTRDLFNRGKRRFFALSLMSVPLVVLAVLLVPDWPKILAAGGAAFVGLAPALVYAYCWGFRPPELRGIVPRHGAAQRTHLHGERRLPLLPFCAHDIDELLPGTEDSDTATYVETGIRGEAARYR